MRRSDLIDSNVEEHQLCGSMHCPGCGHKLEGKPDWVGLPAGVKFDPTDQELIEHLEAKVEAKEYSKSHPLIDEFITTIEGEDGICYTHPEKLPGVTRDGLSRHFFHRPSKAYTTGTRKRRKIQTETDFQGGSGGGETRWHKTGKTRPVMVNGEQKGCKKILVLYTNFGKNRKPEKTSWVMHQYHLGQDDEEKEGELVVSKIFYQTQPRQSNINWSDRVLGGGSSSNTSNSSAFCGGDQMAAAAIYGDLEVQKLKAEHFGFDPFGKSFDEVGMVGEGSAKTCQTRDHQSQMPHHVSHDHQMAPHVSRPSPSMSAIVSPPFHHLHHHHHTSINILHDHHQDNPSSFHVSSMMLQNQTRQGQGQGQEQEKEQNDKVLGRSASGLEEIIMACTSTTDIKEKESSSSIITNPQEAEWLKYSSTTFWPHPHNPNHQG